MVRSRSSGPISAANARSSTVFPALVAPPMMMFFFARTAAEKNALVAKTPLWFYILREAELNNGRLKGVGARIVVETFHRAIEGSRFSIVRDPSWKPFLGPRPGTFDMPDLLFFALSGKPGIAPVG